MSKPTHVTLAAAGLLALGACGYAEQSDETDTSGEIVTDTEPPVSARETTPASPDAGKTEADTPTEEGTGRLVDPPRVEAEEDDAEDDEGSQGASGDSREESGGEPNR